MGVQQDDADWPQQAHLVFCGGAHAVLFQRSSFGTGLTKAARADDGGAQPALAAFMQGLGDVFSGDQQDSQVHGIGDFFNIGIDWASQQAAAFRVNEVHDALVVALHQVARQAVAELGGILGCADHGDASG